MASSRDMTESAPASATAIRFLNLSYVMLDCERLNRRPSHHLPEEKGDVHLECLIPA